MQQLVVLNNKEESGAFCEEGLQVNEEPHKTQQHFKMLVPPKPPTQKEQMLADLEKSGYRFVGEHKHSANKICEYTKKALVGAGHCYKQKWYGMKSHQCVQCTVSLFCMTRCAYCWRSFRAFMGGGMEGDPIDDPETIINGLVEAQEKLLSGFGGNPRTIKERYQESFEPSNFAISLVGESILYPKLPEFIRLLRQRGASSYLVTKGTYPEGLKKLLESNAEPTNLYISLCAPDKETFTKLERPVIPNAWERQVESLRIARSFTCRKVVRITSVKGCNMHSPEKYAELIKLEMPEYIEVKAYSHVGDSQQRLPMEASPGWEEMMLWARQIAGAAGYIYTDEFEHSKVILLCRDQRLVDEVLGNIERSEYPRTVSPHINGCEVESGKA